MRGTLIAGAICCLGLVTSIGLGQAYQPAEVVPTNWAPPPNAAQTSPPPGYYPVQSAGYYPPPVQPAATNPAQPVNYLAPVAQTSAVEEVRHPAQGCSSCSSCGCCCDDSTFWIVGEFLYWKVRGAQLPPLLTASVPGTAQNLAGVLGAPGTAVLFGGERVNDDMRPGGRFRAGFWLDQDQKFGVEASFFILEGRGEGITAGARDGSRVVSRPFVDALTGMPNSELVSFPGVLGGTASVDAGSTNLYGYDASLLYNLCCGTLRVGNVDSGCFRVDLLGGYRSLRYSDSVQIRENLTPLGPQFAAGTRIQLTDDFAATNLFRGGFLGVATDARSGPWSVVTRLRLGVGQVERSVRVGGETLNIVPGAQPLPATGGLLALASNIGNHGSNSVTVVPEGDLWLGYRVNDCLRLFAGSSFIWWPRVVRAGEQIDTVVNPNLLPPVAANVAGPSRPSFVLHSSDLWVYGVSCGLEVSY